MKKIFKSNGNIVIKDVPAPNIEKGFILVKNNYSVISTGTELASLSKMNLLSRANKNNFWKVVGIIKQQGPLKGPQRVISEIKEKSFLAIGYSCAGEIVEVGEGVDEFKKGDKVACGGEYANHAEYVLVPENLAVKVPSNVELEKAALATIASIALQSVRRLEPTIGETIAVVGLGLIGQITAQILKVNGCRVIGIDVNPERVKSEYIDLGLKDFNKSEIFNFTQHNGVDGVIIAASTEANLVNDSFDICRKKGRVVLLGVCGLNIDRNKMYNKELNFLVSMSYGPGRYDINYEEKGLDYPIGYVRWTEKRNMAAILELLKEKKLNFDKLIGNVYPIENAVQAYEDIKNKNYFSCLLKYDAPEIKERKKIIREIKFNKEKINIGIIGAGSFVKSTHLPNLREKLNKYYNIYAICDKAEIQAEDVAKRYRCKYYTTDYRELLRDKEVDAILVGTRHNTHAQISIEAIQAGKHVFCEKPMALDINSAQKICDLLKEKKGIIYTVGYNRRYASLAIKAKEWLEDKNGCLIINYIVNTGYTPKNHWVLDKDIGGGRIKGDACHMIDFLNWFVDKEIKGVKYEFLNSGEFYDQNNLVLTLKYNDGSIGNLIYTAIGHRSFSKEYITILKNQNQIIIDDFEKININGKMEKTKQDKGSLKELEEFAKKIKGEKSLILDEIDAFKVTELIDKLK